MAEAESSLAGKTGEDPTFQAATIKLEELNQTEEEINNFYCIFSVLPLPIVYEGKKNNHF